MILKGTFWVKDSELQSENQVLLLPPQKSDSVSSTGGAQSQLKPCFPLSGTGTGSNANITKMEFKCFYLAITLQESTLRHPSPKQEQHLLKALVLLLLRSFQDELEKQSPSFPSCQAQAEQAAAPACPAVVEGL